MSFTTKPFEDLSVIDDFLMSALATDPEIGESFCRKMLSVLLQRNIGKVRVVAQRTIPATTPGNRGIRMDVEVEELTVSASGATSVMNLYDIEPHRQDKLHLPKHNRFFQAKIDGRYMQRGKNDFSRLPNLFVITILNYDPFGYDYMMYTIKNRCLEVPDLYYEDGLQFIYFNTTGTKGGNQEIRETLRFIQSSTSTNVTNESTRELYEYVSKVKIQPEVRLEYMRFDEIIYWERQDAAEEAVAKTRKESILELLEEHGVVPESIKEKIQAEDSTETLKAWHKLAAKAGSLSEFAEKM